jgi:GR25 family glycosyltransferase involved in LPS biosynthesis
MHAAHLRDMTGLVAEPEISFDGDCLQDNGVELPIVAINLQHRADRWDALVRRMAAVGIDKITRMPAVDGRKLPAGRIGTLLCPSVECGEAPRSHLSLTPPAVGCFLSHLAVWRWIVRRGLPRVLVLEDDAIPSAEHTPDTFRKTMASIPADIDHVFLGRIIMGGLAEPATATGLGRMYYFNGTFAYLITPGACTFLLEHLLPMRAHIDHQISGLLVAQRRIYQAHYTDPPLFEPDWALRSDCYVPIHDDKAADAELGRIMQVTRSTLVREGRFLLPLAGADAGSESRVG